MVHPKRTQENYGIVVKMFYVLPSFFYANMLEC